MCCSVGHLLEACRIHAYVGAIKGTDAKITVGQAFVEFMAVLGRPASGIGGLPAQAVAGGLGFAGESVCTRDIVRSCIRNL